MILTMPEVRNLNLVDVPSHAFKRVLEYLYDGILPRGDQHLKMKDVYAVAHKLGLMELKEHARGEMSKDGCAVSHQDDNLSVNIDEVKAMVECEGDKKEVLEREIVEEQQKLNEDDKEAKEEVEKTPVEPQVQINISKELKTSPNVEIKHNTMNDSKLASISSSNDIEEEFEEFVKITKDLTIDQFEIIDDFYDEVCSLNH